MKPTDRRYGPLPARTMEPASQPSPNPSPTIPVGRRRPRFANAPTARRRFSARVIGRAFRRYWWQALFFWAAGSAVLGTLALGRGGPAFVASTEIEIGNGDRSPSIESQARRITDPDVIALALANRPELLELPRLALPGDPRAAIRAAMVVTPEPRSGRVQVSIAGDSSEAAASVVDAVVDAYLQADREAAEREAEARRRRLDEDRERRAEAVRLGRDVVTRLVERVGSIDAGRARDRDSAAAEAYGVLTRELLKCDLELIEARSNLDRIRGGSAEPASVGTGGPDAEVVAAFYADSKVADLQSKLDRARDGQAGPDRAASKAQVESLQLQIDGLWAEMKPGLVSATRRLTGREARTQAAEARVRDLEGRMKEFGSRLEEFNARTRATGLDELALEFARQDLGRAESVLDALSRAEPEAQGPEVRPRREGPTRTSIAPEAALRRKAMLGAPALMFLASLALVTLIEFRAGRVSDPEDLPGRLRLEVLGIVPPLPGPRESRRVHREIDRFAQSLDHLRVAIGSGEDHRGRPLKSVVVTSARKGEGKTTLAAQLAERSVNAGLLTLLIDADFRNPALSRTLDLAGRRGLAEVLAGESAAEEVITVVGGAGGFHFLPAGSPRVAPGRLLQDARLGRLLARARESFDLVIVDAPPVLPVPDALTLGRWLDAALLVVRFDQSRYPMLERARRKLTAVGVPILGAVVVGVPGGDGTYDPAYGSKVGDDGRVSFDS
ncbi:polysaccharide biosynthesis tyrosine autokinase (plasmid) [Tundrisphaera lichenicola]|uniref:tyrosine-protein kinase domain-containing protein n=1 Tax=Tundrisphaera lichenicola TaxID=2029860 RepID=UPI003EB6A727